MSDTIKWIEDQLRYNNDSSLQDVAGGLASILKQQQREIEDIRESVDGSNKRLVEISNEVARNRSAIMGDSEVGFSGIIAEMRGVSKAVKALSAEMAATRHQFDTQSVENQRELKRLSGAVQRTTIILSVVVVVLSVLVLYAVIGGFGVA